MNDKSTVLYYNRGTANYIRLFVSIFSLRKWYQGSVTVMQEGAMPPEIATILGALNTDVQIIEPLKDYVLVRKASLWREMQCLHAMYLDSDTVVRGPIDEFFGWIKEWGFVASWFSGWLTSKTLIRKRIEQWNKIDEGMVKAALAYPNATNSGVQGWTKGHAILPEYEALTRRGFEANCNRRVLDEIALQLLLPEHRHHLAHHRWNTSGKFGNVKEAQIIHYHGRKHSQENFRCDIWKAHYFELLASHREHRKVLEESWGDKRLEGFRKKLKRRPNVTVVTATNPAYVKRLRRNLKRWMQTRGLRQQRFVVLVNGFKSEKETAFLKKYPRVEVVPWDYPGVDANPREGMLAAFIFGAADAVQTEYWMKLDADCRPKTRWWEWPDYEKYTIVSHRWGFTRMKGGASSRHWFNRLDEVFSPGKPYFPREFDAVKEARISHRPKNGTSLPGRFNSFCHIEKTAFTQRMAAHLRAHNGGKMAIPSQDTTSWYCAELWGEEVKLVNMHRWFKQ